MNQNRKWNVLYWNIRGMNASRKWDSVRNKVLESICDIVCFQETKKYNFDMSFIRKILPAPLDDFIFAPSVGASGGLLVAWKYASFTGSLKFVNSLAIAIDFTSRHNDSTWSLLNVYGPCTSESKREFITWLKGIDINL